MNRSLNDKIPPESLLSNKPDISIVIPLFNEQQNVNGLVDDIKQALSQAEFSYEVILVDDGSVDATWSQLQLVRDRLPGLQLIRLRRNFGQTAAMSAGFDHARGDVIIPMDGDLQNDPADIPRLLDKLREGYDVVSGWRKNRHDDLLTRKVPSWIANSVIGAITGVHLHDYGCTLKAYHRDVVKHIRLYGEMHRFIPALASWTGASVAEVVVNHRPRRHGKTKYGLGRTFKVILDLITVKFLGTFSTRPLHVFGIIGLFSVIFSLLTGLTMIFQKLRYGIDMSGNPLLVLSAVLGMMSIQFLLMGLLAEMLSRTYHESQNKPTYIVREIVGGRRIVSDSPKEESVHG